MVHGNEKGQLGLQLTSEAPSGFRERAVVRSASVVVRSASVVVRSASLVVRSASVVVRSASVVVRPGSVVVRPASEDSAAPTDAGRGMGYEVCRCG